MQPLRQMVFVCIRVDISIVEGNKNEYIARRNSKEYVSRVRGNKSFPK
jgi:hypothetical protein